MAPKLLKQKNTCPEGKYWVPPYTRKRIDKNGKPYTQHVKGYCSSYHGPFHEIAIREKMSLDHLYFALTVYGEARSENTVSKQAIAWIIQNRFDRSGKNTYQKVVLRRTQFSCWMKSDKNYEKLKHPGEANAADKRSWEEIKKITEEVRNAPKNQNPILMFTTILAANLKRNGKSTILIYLILSAFILLGLNEICYAISFNEIKNKIQRKSICGIDYNLSKTAAIVSPDCHSAIYINFKTRQTKTIVDDWPNVFSTWKADNIVHLKGSCGTGCSQSIIFIAPSISIVCPVHEYRFESLSEDYPPDFYNNNPLLIEPHKKIYVCYAEANVIQVFQMPKQLKETIRPPKGYYAEEAFIRDHHLMINYRDVKEHIKQVRYQKIKL